MGFLADCKADLIEGIRDNAASSIDEAATGQRHQIRRYMDNPNKFTRRFASSLMQGYMINRSIKTGYDPVRTMMSARLMQSMHPAGPGPVPIHDGLEM